MVNVVYACNDTYVRQTIVSMVSVVKHNPGARLYLVSDGISAENQNLIKTVLGKFHTPIRGIELKDVLPDISFGESGRHPWTIYAKLFLDSVIPEKRVLYLDSDVVVAGSLEPLFFKNLYGAPVAGVLMPYSSKTKQRVFCKPGVPYLCDGIVLFDLEQWKEQKNAAACISYIREHQGRPPMLSEGTLNHVCGSKVVILPPKYNVMPSMLMYNLKQIKMLFRPDRYYDDQDEFNEAKRCPVMIHFMNELYDRPWCEASDHPLKNYYLEIEQQVFGENQLQESTIPAHTERTKWLQKHLPFPVFAALYHWKNRI